MKHILPLIFFAAQLASSLAASSNSHTVLIHNKIKPEMLEYTFLKIGYSPESFKLQINGTEVKPGTCMSIPNSQTTMTVRYDYSFAKGWRTGAKEITFELDPKNTECNLEFSWHDKWRVIASGAKPQKVKRMKYHPS